MDFFYCDDWGKCGTADSLQILRVKCWDKNIILRVKCWDKNIILRVKCGVNRQRGPKDYTDYRDFKDYNDYTNYKDYTGYTTWGVNRWGPKGILPYQGHSSNVRC